MFNSQKKYFERKLEGVQKMIWDLQFKRFKTLEIREEIRQEYDNLKSKLYALDAQESNPTIEDKKTLLNRDIERMEEQMKGLDIEVNGCKPSAEYHDGVQGISQQIDALQELMGMIKSYIREL